MVRVGALWDGSACLLDQTCGRLVQALKEVKGLRCDRVTNFSSSNVFFENPHRNRVTSEL